MSDPASAPSVSDPQLAQAAKMLLPEGTTAPEIGVVLGSGLGSWAEGLTESRSVDYSAIVGMTPSGVAGHGGKLWLGKVGKRSIACLQGRVHAYEGHPIEKVVFGVRLLAQMGCRCVLLTNAAGGIRPDLTPGSLMLLTDHINLTGRNPLVAWRRKGGSFVDMSCAYDSELRAQALSVAGRLGIDLKQGVYAALLGPSYETPAEVAMVRTLGADAVGMSTAVETIALRAEGVAVGAISCITNAAAGTAAGTLNHDEVQTTAAETSERFASLLNGWIERL